MKTLRTFAKIFVFILSSVFFTFCSERNLDNAPDAAPADLKDFFNSLPEWDAFSPQLESANVPLGDPVPEGENTDIDGTKYTCSTTAYSMTNTPDKITTLNPDVEILYVGSLLQGKGYLNGIGSLSELPIRQRAPVELTLDLLTTENNRKVENPTVSTINQAIGELISDATADGHKSGSNISYSSEVTYSLEQASLKMGLSANYMGATIKASLSSNFSQEKRTITAYFVQQMFTASMVLPQYPEDVFSDAFTQELLNREESSGRMGPDNLPVYVSSIVYGRILMFTFTSTSTEAKIQATLNAMYNGGDFGGELDNKLQSVLKNAEISVVTVGGDADHALSLIRENNLAAFFTKDAPLTSAKPISYTVRNLNDNTIASVSETTEYNMEECTVAEPTGAEYTIKLTRIVAPALPNIDPIAELTPHRAEIYYTFYLEDLAGPSVAANINPFFYIMPIGEGESKDLKNQEIGKAQFTDLPEFTGLPLHLDGRDRIRIYGDLWDNDDPALATDDKFHFNRVFQGANGLPFEDNQTRQFSITSEDSSGNKFVLYGNYTRTKLLYD